MVKGVKQMLEEELGVTYRWSFASSFDKLLEVVERTMEQSRRGENNCYPRLSADKENRLSSPRQVTFSYSFNRSAGPLEKSLIAKPPRPEKSQG